MVVSTYDVCIMIFKALNMIVMAVENSLPCERSLISVQNNSWELRGGNHLLQKPLAKFHTLGIVISCQVLYSLKAKWVHPYLMHDVPYIGMRGVEGPGY